LLSTGQVAVFVPWRQDWTLEGYTRGELLYSIALAPRESHSVVISDRSTTLGDADEVFREMARHEDLQTQAHGDVDATYKVAEGGSPREVSIRFSQDLVLLTQQAVARVRSRRVNKITESHGAIADRGVVKEIRNPSDRGTLTVHCYETLAHYSVLLEPVLEAVKPVVLVDSSCDYVESGAVARFGNQLALPVSPARRNELTTLIGELSATLDAASPAQRQDMVLPTPGIAIETSLGDA
jgi:hypothetical protein